MNNTNFCVIIPTYNAGNDFPEFLQALETQDLNKNQVLFIDSSSNDNTVGLIKTFGYPVQSILANDFNHGRTRQQALESFKNTDAVIYLTQDAILNDSTSILNIINMLFSEPAISAVCGRQIPHDNANDIAAHARTFNYPNKSFIRTQQDIPNLGIKCAFMSNSFAAYKVEALNTIGGFPSNTILCEDMYVTAKMILADYKIGYCADAIVKHSHNYTAFEEFKRYFDIGVFHTNEPWIQKFFGTAGNEGKKFIASELNYLKSENILLILKSLINNLSKVVGYRLGHHYQLIPKSLVKKLSMHQAYWH